MSLFSKYIDPLVDKYGQLIEGRYLAQQLQYKGSQQQGGDYISRVNRSKVYEITKYYESSVTSVRDCTYLQFLTDNLPRLLLNPIDRLVTAYQAYPSLKARFYQPGTLSHTFTEILNQGAILGSFKGFLFNFAQFSFVLYPSVYFANRFKENKYLMFMSTYTALDILFYPLDSLKNILYAETLQKSSTISVLKKGNLGLLYSGIINKIIYNIPLMSAFYLNTQSNRQKQSLAAWAATALLYPINNIKTRIQLSSTYLSTVSNQTGMIYSRSYQGVVPFLLLNYLVSWQLRPLFDQQKLAAAKEQALSELRLKNLSYDQR